MGICHSKRGGGMKRIWGFIATLFIGFSAGLIFAVKWLVPEKVVFKGKIRLNQRGRGNTQLTDIRPEINANTKREDKKAERQAKRDERRSK